MTQTSQFEAAPLTDPPDLPPYPPNLASPADAPESSLAADHLDGIAIAEPEGSHGEGPIQIDGASPATFTKEQFRQNFVGVHKMAATLTRLQSLDIPDKELPLAHGAADAIYDIAAETPWLRFLIEPGNVWIQRAMVIAAYAVPKSMAVAAELKARRVVKAVKDGTYTPDGKNNANPAEKLTDPMAAFPKDAKS